MSWNSAAEMLAMGGYGIYVWGSFGMVALAIGAEVLLVGLRWRRAAGRERLPITERQ